MSRWANATARLNRAVGDFYDEGLTILRPSPGSAYVKGGDLDVILVTFGVISEGDSLSPADGESPGGRGFNLQLAAGEILGSFERTRFATGDQEPRKFDLIRRDDLPGTPLLEVVRANWDDGDRLGVVLVRKG